MSNAIDSCHESNRSRRIFNLRAVLQGHVADIDNLIEWQSSCGIRIKSVRFVTKKRGFDSTVGRVTPKNCVVLSILLRAAQKVGYKKFKDNTHVAIETAKSQNFAILTVSHITMCIF